MFQYKFFKTLKLITGDEFKWQKYQELTRELDKKKVIERQEVKEEEELKDNFFNSLNYRFQYNIIPYLQFKNNNILRSIKLNMILLYL